ncbi:unnamed protein product [Amoebophrya sp. A120]|nr:unnamed protein product [Amoebophrya sp. A120]|eukprot:GSA120T00003528001.1
MAPNSDVLEDLTMVMSAYPVHFMAYEGGLCQDKWNTGSKTVMRVGNGPRSSEVVDEMKKDKDVYTASTGFKFTSLALEKIKKLINASPFVSNEDKQFYTETGRMREWYKEMCIPPGSQWVIKEINVPRNAAGGHNALARVVTPLDQEVVFQSRAVGSGITENVMYRKVKVVKKIPMSVLFPNGNAKGDFHCLSTTKTILNPAARRRVNNAADRDEPEVIYAAKMGFIHHRRYHVKKPMNKTVMKSSMKKN